MDYIEVLLGRCCGVRIGGHTEWGNGVSAVPDNESSPCPRQKLCVEGGIFEHPGVVYDFSNI